MMIWKCPQYLWRDTPQGYSQNYWSHIKSNLAGWKTKFHENYSGNVLYLTITKEFLRKHETFFWYPAQAPNLEAIRSRRHVQTQGCPVNPVTIYLCPQIQCVSSQQVKNLSERF